VISTEDRAAAPSFFVVGGTLRNDAASYVARDADASLFGAIKDGEFCYVLTPRQMGKSSLMVRTAARLRSENVRVAVLDLTALGQNLTIEQWYNGLLERIADQLELEDAFELSCLNDRHLGPLDRCLRALREVLLTNCTGPIVIFIDEIDSVRSLAFSTDEFFAGIRELYNRRARDPELARLTFCLLGVATPSDLIRDTRVTPFNIGRRIELTDFTVGEALPLASGLSRNGQESSHLLRRILYWTGGHPYLTQRLCSAVADEGARSTAAVDRVCEELFLSLSAREHDDNLLFVRERMLRSELDTTALLTLYDKIHRGRKIWDDDTNPLIAVLRLTGITRSENGRLKLRNRIYEHVFDRHWVKANTPGAELRRQRAAYKRGLQVAAFAATPILLAGTYVLFTLYRHSVAPPSSKNLSPPPFWASFSLSSKALMTTGTLLVRAEEPDVLIFIGGQEYGRTGKDGSLQVDGLQAGNYNVRAEKPGLQTVSFPVEIKAQSATPLSLKLQEQSQVLDLGSMFIQGAPPGAHVSLDGTDVGLTSENGSFLLTAPPGQHTVRVAKEEFLTQETKQEFKLGSRLSVDATLTPDVEIRRWKTLTNGNDLPGLEVFLHDYPTGRFSELARSRIEQLEWNVIKDRKDSEAVRALSDFVNSCRNTPYCEEARARMSSLAAEDEAWLAVSHSKDLHAYRQYLSDYPQGRYVQQARDQITNLTNEQQIRELIRQYESAYNRKDLSQMISLWPTFPPIAQQRMQDLFNGAKSVTMTLSVGDPKITGGSAIVICKRTRDIVRADEGGGHTQDQVTFHMTKQGDHWTIESAPH
jgi:hypothetical protein